jgi:hypothetical protein
MPVRLEKDLILSTHGELTSSTRRDMASLRVGEFKGGSQEILQ